MNEHPAVHGAVGELHEDRAVAGTEPHDAGRVAARLGVRIRDSESLETAGRKLMEALGTKALLITRGNQGMALFEGLYAMTSRRGTS